MTNWREIFSDSPLKHRQIVVGDEIQVYSLGEAYFGVLMSFGKVDDIDEDVEGNRVYHITGIEGWWGESEYDIVLVDLDNPVFEKFYRDRN